MVKSLISPETIKETGDVKSKNSSGLFGKTNFCLF